MAKGFIDDPKAVFFTQIFDEINFAAEDFGKLYRHVVRDASLVGGPKERIGDNAFGHFDLGLGRYGVFLGLKALVSRGNLEPRSEEHTSELQSRGHLVCRLLLEKKKKQHEYS